MKYYSIQITEYEKGEYKVNNVMLISEEMLNDTTATGTKAKAIALINSTLADRKEYAK